MPGITYPTANIRRLFGYTDDVVGGTTYENLTSPGVVPDATTFWPATGGQLDRGLSRIDRAPEVRGRRSVAVPLPFRAAPAMTIPFPAYRSVVEKLVRKCLGGTDTVTGSATTGYTHTLNELGFGSTQLPTMAVQMVRDDLNHKMSGGYVNRVTLDFPLDAEGTIEAEIQGLYYTNYSSAAPTAVYTDVDNVLLLRDAYMYIDAQAVAIPDLVGVNLTFNNNIDRKWYSNHNCVTQSALGASPLLRKLWFPSQYKLGAQLDISGTLTFGNVNTAQDLALDFGQVQKFQFTVVGGPIAGTTGPQYEAIQITLNATQLTADSQAAAALAARGDITYAVNFGGFYSSYDGFDTQFSSINQISTPLV
jgi:hypothetical protein